MSTAISLLKVSVVPPFFSCVLFSPLFERERNIVDHGSISSSTEHLGRVSDGGDGNSSVVGQDGLGQIAYPWTTILYVRKEKGSGSVLL